MYSGRQRVTRKTKRARLEIVGGNRRKVALLSLALVAATIVVYADSLPAAFTFDDISAIVENPQLGKFWPLTPVLLGVRGAPSGGRPLTSLSFNLNALIAGRNPAGYRAVNVVIHVAAGLVLFALLRSILGAKTRPDGSSNGATSLGFAVSLLWLVHPIQTESVTYVSQRAESLMGLFFLIALYCAVRGFEEREPKRWFRFAAVASALSVLSKEVGVITPLIILAYDRLFVSRSLRRALGRHRLLYGGLAFSWVTAGVLQLTAPRGYSVSLSNADVTPWGYLQRQLVALPGYLKLVFWPSPLVFDYGYPPPVPPIAHQVLGASLLILLAAASVWALRRWPLAGLSGAAFFLILVPTSTVIPIVTEVVAEHRMYLPLACVLGVVIGGAREVARATNRRWLNLSPSTGRFLGWFLLLTAALGLGLLTWQRNSVYRSELSLWQDTVAKAPDNPRALNNLGWALLRAGNNEEALVRLQKAVSLRPGYFEANGGTALALEHLGRVAEALPYMRRAAAINPGSAPAHESLVRLLVRLNRWNEALVAAKAYVERLPDAQRSNYLYGSLLSRAGRAKEALPYLQRAHELASRNIAGATNQR
jgi:tetratricopeptide (TPR) repeat protein